MATEARVEAGKAKLARRGRAEPNLMLSSESALSPAAHVPAESPWCQSLYVGLSHFQGPCLKGDVSSCLVGCADWLPRILCRANPQWLTTVWGLDLMALS